jgi:hypothetical protein
MANDEHRETLKDITRSNHDIEEIFVSFRDPVTEIFRRYKSADDDGKDVLFMALLSRAAMNWVRYGEGLAIDARLKEDMASVKMERRGE